MAASPIDITTPRYGSSSPRNQTSNLTSQLQEAGALPTSNLTVGHRAGNEGRPTPGRHESFGNMFGTSQGGSGARPIYVNDRLRRESTALAGSLANGMSWGGVSVGSWIRDDIIMAGTSPYNFQSPSFHSSSYLPKMEAQFMKDYICCGETLDSLHELLQHYEEAHAQVPTQTMGRTPQSQRPAFPNRQTADASNAAAAAQQQSQRQQAANAYQGTQSGLNGVSGTASGYGAQQNSSSMFGGTSLAPVQDLDNLEDMEMDDATSGLPAQQQQQQQSQAHQNFQPQQQFGRQNQHMPSVNVNMANALQGQQRLRSSTPTTPQAGNQGFPLQHNPTVSSVNTPTFSTASSNQHQNKSSPESSVPGTPAELDQDLSNLYGNFDPNFDPTTMQGVNTDWGNKGNFTSSMSNLYIDEPAKRLFSKQGGFSNQHTGFTNGQFGANGELAKRMREQQLMAGMGGNPVGFPGEEIKPFRCPVIGCEKAYKNQNGLKYHKQHGHQNQQLKENPDGTFSIVDPVTSVPYPGTVGMEKEKPYRCEVCGKRYKNLNGLKYHRQHSPPCNPELKLNPAAVPGAPSHISAMNVNVAGAGLLGLGDNNGLF